MTVVVVVAVVAGLGAIAVAVLLRHLQWEQRHLRPGVGVVIACRAVAGTPGAEVVRVQLDLQVELPPHPPYRSVSWQEVPARRVAELVPGAELAVRADAAVPERVVVRWASTSRPPR